MFTPSQPNELTPAESVVLVATIAGHIAAKGEGNLTPEYCVKQAEQIVKITVARLNAAEEQRRMTQPTRG